jgi:hypothetical protein
VCCVLCCCVEFWIKEAHSTQEFSCKFAVTVYTVCTLHITKLRDPDTVLNSYYTVMAPKFQNGGTEPSSRIFTAAAGTSTPRLPSLHSHHSSHEEPQYTTSVQKHFLTLCEFVFNGLAMDVGVKA